MSTQQDPAGHTAKTRNVRRRYPVITALMACMLCGCVSPVANLSISKSAELLRPNSTYGTTGVFHVRGNAAKPGTYNLTSSTTLLKAISMAGGLSGPSPAYVDVLRTHGKTVTLRFDLVDIRNGKASDPKIYDGDLILIPE